MPLGMVVGPAHGAIRTTTYMQAAGRQPRTKAEFRLSQGNKDNDARDGEG
jgi:hypothetical protein